MEGGERRVPVRLRVTDVSKYFPGVQALKAVSLEFGVGEVHALVGENGAGKSTLIKILSGVYQPDSGSVELDGRVVTIPNPHAANSLGIETVPQEIHLVPLLSVAENIFLGRQPRRRVLIDEARRNKEARRILDDLEVQIDPEMPAGGLSAAKRQMVSIARALSTDARVIIFDEPTASLSQPEATVLFATIRRLKRRGMSVIYISHRLQEIFEIADRVTVLRDSAVIDTLDVEGANVDQIIAMMIGRERSQLFVRSEFTQPGDTVLKVEGLSVGAFVRDVSFEVRAGELLTLAGLVGSGRTEVVRAIYGADRIESGRIDFLGRPVKIRSPTDSLGLGIGLAPEDRRKDGLVLPMSVRENIVLAAINSPKNPLARPWYSIRRVREVAARFVQILHIKLARLDQPARALSGGNQQKVVIAKWMATDSRLLILDEPTQGVDVGAKAEIYKLIGEFLRNGMAILMVSSDLSEVVAVSDRVLVMHRGRIVAEFDRQGISEEGVARAAVGQAMNSVA